jgi:hypothetical protein
MPYVVLVVASAGVAASRAEAAVRRRDADLGRLVAGALALVPVVLMPDAAGRTWDAVQPVRFPEELAEAVAVLDDADGSGDVVTLPWASYRQFSWGNPVSAADPLPRWTRRSTVVSDTLTIAGGEVAGEDPRAREVGAVVADPSAPMADRLAGLGVGWALVYRDQAGAEDVNTTGMTLVIEGPDVALWAIPDVDLEAGPGTVSGPGEGAIRVVVAVDAAWALAGLAGVLGAGVITLRRRPRRG